MADIPDQAITEDGMRILSAPEMAQAYAAGLQDAYAQGRRDGAAAERERIRQLAIENDLGGCYLMIAQAIGDTDGTATMLNHFKTSTP